MVIKGYNRIQQLIQLIAESMFFLTPGGAILPQTQSIISLLATMKEWPVPSIHHCHLALLALWWTYLPWIAKRDAGASSFTMQSNAWAMTFTPRANTKQCFLSGLRIPAHTGKEMNGCFLPNWLCLSSLLPWLGL